MSIRRYINLLESIEKEHLNEGVTFGRKEIAKIEKNHADYNVGMEFEFFVPDEDIVRNTFPLLGSSNAFDDLFEEGTIGTPLQSREDFEEAKKDTTNYVAISHGNFVGFMNYNLSTAMAYEGIDGKHSGTIRDIDKFNHKLLTDAFLDGKFEGESVIAFLDWYRSLVTDYEMNKTKSSNGEYSDAVFHVKQFVEFYALEEEGVKILDYVLSTEGNRIFKCLEHGKTLFDGLGVVHQTFMDWYADYQGGNDTDSMLKSLEDTNELMAITSVLNGVSKDITMTLPPVVPEFTEYYPVEDVLTYSYGSLIDIDDMSVGKLLGEYGVKYSKIEKEYNDSIEVITDVMPVKDALENVTNMFALIDDHGRTNNKTGLHISVSSNKWDLKSINFEKLMILMNFDYIHTMKFPSREHVSNFNEAVSNQFLVNLDDVVKILRKKSSSVQASYDGISQYLDITKLAKQKYQSLNAKEYHVSNGRIELRYFGGEDYEDRYEEIRNELFRSLTLLDVSYGEMYDREFQKAKYIYLDNMITESIGIGMGSLVKLVNAIDRTDFQKESEIEEYYPRSVVKLLKDIRDSIPLNPTLVELLERIF